MLGATGGALAFSSATLLVSLFAAFSIYNDVSSLWRELDTDIMNFKASTFIIRLYSLCV